MKAMYHHNVSLRAKKTVSGSVIFLFKLFLIVHLACEVGTFPQPLKEQVILQSVADSSCVRGRGEKNKYKGHQLHVLGHQCKESFDAFMVKQFHGWLRLKLFYYVI